MNHSAQQKDKRDSAQQGNEPKAIQAEPDCPLKKGWTPQRLAQITRGHWYPKPPQQNLQNFCHDTRKLQKADCFVALLGSKDDGHHHLEPAHQKGARAAIVAKARQMDLPQLVVADPFLALQACARAQRARWGGTLIAITGSCGKTTTKDCLAQLLEARGCLATHGNQNSQLGVPLTLLKLRSHHRYAVIEVGIDAPNQMAQHARMVQADMVVLTALGAAHLKGMGTLETLIEEKLKLIGPETRSLICPKALLSYPQLAKLAETRRVLSHQEASVPLSHQASDPSAKAERSEHQAGIMASERASTPSAKAERSSAEQKPSSLIGEPIDPAASASPHIQRYSIQYEAKPSHSHQKTDANSPHQKTDATCVRLSGPLGFAALRLAFPASKGYVQNLIAAALGLHGLGETMEAKRLGELEAHRPSELRGRWHIYKHQRILADCYNANPAAFHDSLEHFIHCTAEPRLYVLGTMDELGAESQRHHTEVARRIPYRKGDQVLLVGAEAAAYQDGLRKAQWPAAAIESCPQSQAACSIVANFHGAVLLKASRSVQLEHTLPAKIC